MASAADAAARAEDAVFEYRELFAFFDGDRDGKLTADEFGSAIRALGHAPTESELAALAKTIDRIYGGSLNYTHFIKVISTVVQSKMKHPSDTGAEMLQAFVEFETTCRDKSDGTISKGDLRTLLHKFGDSMDGEAFDQLMRFTGHDGKKDTDALSYAEIVDVLVHAARAANS